jgi:hypothetical protein
MNTMAAQPAIDPDFVVQIIRERGGEYPFNDLLNALSERGLNESQGRELIWQVLALGFIEFNADRSILQLRPNTENEQDEGRVA